MSVDFLRKTYMKKNARLNGWFPGAWFPGDWLAGAGCTGRQMPYANSRMD